MKIIYSRSNGNIEILSPCEGFTAEQVMAKDVPSDATNVHIIADNEIPADRTLRDAWVISSGTLNIDSAKASVIKAANSSVAKA